MNKLQIFESPEFGQIRTIEVDGEPWLVGKDVAEALGYSDTFGALKKHVDAEDKQNCQNDSFGTPRGMTIINESGLYSLALSSKLPTAKKFRRWVTAEVLPSIRKTGQYTAPAPASAMELLRIQSQAMFELDNRMTTLEDKLDNQMTLDHGQQRRVQQAVAARVLERVATVLPARLVHERKPAFFQALYRDLKNRFGVPSYRDIRPVDYSDAMAYVESWIEPATLRWEGGAS